MARNEPARTRGPAQIDSVHSNYFSQFLFPSFQDPCPGFGEEAGAGSGLLVLAPDPPIP